MDVNDLLYSIMNGKLIFDSESAPGGPSGRQVSQSSQYITKLTGNNFDMDFAQKLRMQKHNNNNQLASLQKTNYPQQQHSFDSHQYNNRYPLQFISGQSELKHNYSDSDEPSSFYQPIPSKQHYYSSCRRFKTCDRLPKHKQFENSYHPKLLDSNIFMSHTDHHLLSTPTVSGLSEFQSDNKKMYLTTPSAQMPTNLSHPFPISRETAFKPINHKSFDRNASSSSSQSIHECNSESYIIANINNEVGHSSNKVKINSTPNLLDYINTINPSVSSCKYNNPLIHTQQQFHLQQLKQFQQRNIPNHSDNRLQTTGKNCTTRSMEELLKRQKKLDHLQYCLQRYEIEREEAGQAIRRIEERMQELEARASDLLEYDISKNLTSDTLNPLQQQWRNLTNSINKSCNQSEHFTTDDLACQYIRWLKNIEDSTNTLKPTESDENPTNIYTQNNYMYIESSTNDENDISKHQIKSKCSAEHSFNPISLLNANNTSSLKASTQVDNINNSSETKRNLLLEHLMVQRQRLATADASVALLAKRLILLNTNPKVQQDNTKEKAIYKRKVSYPGNSLEKNISTFDQLVDNQQALTNPMTPNVLRNSKMISGTVNSAIHSEYSTDSIFQSQLPHSSEDDILTHGHSPKPKFIEFTKLASENGYIELANTSSSPTNDEDYTSRLLYGTSKTQLPSRRFFNTNSLNNSMTGFLTPINCSFLSTTTTQQSSPATMTTQPLLCNEKRLTEKSLLRHRPTPPTQQHQLKPVPPLPPKPNQINLQTSIEATQEHLSAEDEEVYKFMSRSFDANEEMNLDFQPLNRNLTDSKQRPLPPPYYVNINDTNNEKLLNQRKIFPHKISRTMNNKTSQLIKQTITQNHDSHILTGGSLTSLNDTTKEGEKEREEEEESTNRLLNPSTKIRKSLNSIDKIKNQMEVNQAHKIKRYIKQKSDYSFNLRDYLQTLHHPINELAIETSDTTVSPEQHGGICLTSLLGNWLTSRTTRAQKTSTVNESLDYFQCKIILTSRICGGYLWIMKKPSRQRNNSNIWDSIMRRVHDTSSNQITNTDNEKHNKRIIIRSSNNARWCRKWLSCDMLEQKIFICERKGCGRIECTINFSTIKDIHQSSTDQLLDCQKSCSLSPRISQKTSSTLLNTNTSNNNTDNNNHHHEVKSSTQQDKHTTISDTNEEQIKKTTINNTMTKQTNCTEKTETLFCLETILHTYFLMAPSSELTRLWIDVLKQAMRMAFNSTSINNG
uniref:Centrosomal protein of 162 kDa n=1 Tax=Schistosoma mansoni TaxID=6183 RepID=A0A5K4FB09_SCHMA